MWQQECLTREDAVQLKQQNLRLFFSSFSSSSFCLLKKLLHSQLVAIPGGLSNVENWTDGKKFKAGDILGNAS